MNFVKNKCPVCEKDTKKKLVYKKNLPNDTKKVDYSGRKIPDNYHYQMVRCLECNLLLADEIYDNETIISLYKESNFDYFNELGGLEKTYSSLFNYINKFNIKKGSFLDIGCANGFLLKKAKEFGFMNISGSEISVKAIDSAEGSVKKFIHQGPFKADIFNKQSFDVVFFAMVIEHFQDPNIFLKDVYKILKPGGMLIGITHDEKHILAKILRNKHPIINDEHISVFDKNTLEKIMKKHSFKVLKVGNLRNYYSIGYWFRMMPFINVIRNIILKILIICKINKKLLGLKAGNIYIICNKNNNEQVF